MNRKPTPEEMAYANALSIESLIDLLVKKNIFTKEEVLKEIKSLGKQKLNLIKNMKK